MKSNPITGAFGIYKVTGRVKGDQAREPMLNGFKDKAHPRAILITTKIVQRGLDAKMHHVIFAHYGSSPSVNDSLEARYTQMVGRVGRNRNYGDAIFMYTAAEETFVNGLVERVDALAPGKDQRLRASHERNNQVYPSSEAERNEFVDKLQSELKTVLQL